MHWRHRGFLCRTKLKQNASARKWQCAWFSGIGGTFWSLISCLGVLRWPLIVTCATLQKWCRCSVLLLWWFPTTIARMRRSAQKISAEGCLTIQSIVLIFLTVLTSIFSCTWRSFCTISIFLPVAKMCRRPSHAGSNPRKRTFMTQDYKNWTHNMESVTIPVVLIWWNSWQFAVFVPINNSR